MVVEFRTSVQRRTSGGSHPLRRLLRRQLPKIDLGLASRLAVLLERAEGSAPRAGEAAALSARRLALARGGREEQRLGLGPGEGEEVWKVAVAVLAAGRGAWWSRGLSHSPEALHACGRDSCPESKWSLKRQCLRRCLGSVSEVSGTCHLSGEASDASDWTLARSPSGAAGSSGGGSSSGESSIASASSDGGHQSSATAGMPAPWTRTSQRGEDGICKGYAQASTAEYSRTPLQPCPLER